MRIAIADNISEFDAHDWNALAGSEYPFLRHEFLTAAETSGSTAPESGWIPRHIGMHGPGGRLGAPGVCAAGVEQLRGDNRIRHDRIDGTGRDAADGLGTAGEGAAAAALAAAAEADGGERARWPYPAAVGCRRRTAPRGCS